MCDLTAKQGALNSGGFFSYKVNDIRLSYHIISYHAIQSIFEKKSHSKYLDSNNNIRSFSRNTSRRSYPVILGLIGNTSPYDDSRVCTVQYITT